MEAQLKIPTLAELVAESETTLADNALTVILNQNPPTNWLCNHPLAKIKNANGEDVPLPYLPINKVEYLLTKIYGKYSTKIKSVQVLANSVVVVVRVSVINPITLKEEHQDGVGAAPIQTDKGAGAMDWNAAKSSGVQIAAPAAESYAIKDAAEKFGKIFGRDLGRRETMDYSKLLKEREKAPTVDDLRELLDMKRDSMSVQDLKDANRIINTNETASFSRLQKTLAAI